jgi:molybdopterin converting factor small subunit
VWLFDNHPQLTGLNKWAVAVNEKYADDSVPIFHGDVVAIIPPVSGG